MRAPITFIYRNLVFRSGPEDVWAVFRLTTRSYAGLPLAAKREVLAELAAMAYTLEADFSLQRVTRPWDVEDYLRGVLAASDPQYAPGHLLEEYLQRQRETLGWAAAHTPEVYLSVRIGADGGGLLWALRGFPRGEAFRRAFGLS